MGLGPLSEGPTTSDSGFGAVDLNVIDKFHLEIDGCEGVEDHVVEILVHGEVAEAACGDDGDRGVAVPGRDGVVGQRPNW